MSDQVRVAVVGVGYLGRFHAQKYLALPDCKLCAVVDSNPERAEEIAAELGVPGGSDLAAVLGKVDAVSIAVPTLAHHAVTLQCLQAGKHVLVEKPLAATLAEAEELVALARAKGVLMQVGFLERFNPAFQICKDRIVKPQFIETIRISSFLERGADVDVVLDLMSHDLDLVLAIAPSPVRNLHAVGKSLMTDSTDLANVRIVFEDGCVANMTVSRISHKTERKMRVFQPDSYLSIDFAKPFARIYQKIPPGRANSESMFTEETHSPDKGDSLLAEVAAFVDAIRSGGPPVVSGDDGLRAMTVADQVMRDIYQNRLP
ncbi:MAG: Gfo/Idh/MocA family oxidoreductase [SAR324 cluster bacterium]|nr:Gfo/Idh/MocA family oxidoreductase [SAR324 cluster bacterium]MCZ6557526.1 Gfo/Idh/MocA family oxidoreductase [SAR324 cluster bacterium]MCZ6626925.1 Gfo/Idh/MocA family oxidoreductase [SAR324 cluster bacterium]MCZ6730556.1 Gfo/Idh/MocA family oxidoreductase [SAR324 cluster bacterium]